jgi:GTP-binding protein
MTIKIFSALFTDCVTAKEALPNDDLPIIALVGRSNVGKSSLINAVTNRKELARTSSLPGKTLTINFYKFNEQFYMVDLPGYGYAKASKVTRQRIQAMMNEFFGECPNLKGVIQILDARHKPSALDKQMYAWLRDQKMNYLTVITKTDKLSNQQLIKMRKVILNEMGLDYSVQFSAKTLSGKDGFLDAIEKILAGYRFKAPDKKPAKAAPKSRNPKGKTADKGSGKKSESGEGNDKAATKGRQPGPAKADTPQKQSNKENSGTGQRRRRRRPNKSSGRKKEPRSDKPNS